MVRYLYKVLARWLPCVGPAGVALLVNGVALQAFLRGRAGVSLCRWSGRFTGFLYLMSRPD